MTKNNNAHSPGRTGLGAMRPYANGHHDASRQSMVRVRPMLLGQSTGMRFMLEECEAPGQRELVSDRGCPLSTGLDRPMWHAGGTTPYCGRVTLGSLAGPPRTGLLRTRELGRTASFLPQAAVLPHCRAVVSHAGAGTMLGALCYGLPQLCLPQGTDQPSNTAALLPTGAALALQPDDITADAVAEALGRLLNEPSFRQAANRLPRRDAAHANRRGRP